MPATKKFLSAMTRRRIQKMLDLVAAKPEKYDQNNYPDNGAYSGHTCETPFCAAGFAVLANDPKRFSLLMALGLVNWHHEANEALKLPRNATSQRLFLTYTDWPEKFKLMYRKAEYRKTEKAQVRGRLKAFLAFWQHILDTDGEYIRY